jgi:Zn-dependent M28 family amino/carboxypeptidase
MTFRARRRLAGLTLVAALFLYVRTATCVERRSIAAQAPAVATAGAVAHHVDRDRLMATVRHLSSAEFAGRRTGTPGGLAARAWITGQFKAIGLEPAGADGSFLQPFGFTHHSVKGLVTPGRPYTTEYPDAANVLGRLPGSRPSLATIVVSAHYDHLGVVDGATYYGADDNASGVAALLEAARWFAAHPPAHPMLFVAFDAEELGLEGSKTFVASSVLPPASIAIDVNLDMVSRNDRNEIFATGTYQSPWLTPIIDDVQRRSAVRILVGHDRPMPKAGTVDDWTDESDQGSFHDKGIPFLYFGVEDHADYHQPTDTADRIDPTFFGNAADMIVEAIVTLDGRMGGRQ